MDTLKIPLPRIALQGFRIDAEVAVKSLQPRNAEDLPVKEVTVHGTLSAVGSEYLFRGHLRGAYIRPCDRCLEEARASFDVDVLWNFEKGAMRSVPGADGEEHEYAVNVAGLDVTAETRTYQGQEIDLGPYVWEELVFAAPAKYLCREDCRGLCPRCGANLNTGPCACAPAEAPKAEANKGLAGLADLFPDLVKENPEE